MSQSENSNKLLVKESEHAHAIATELETLGSILPNGHARQVAHEQEKANFKQAKELRELAQRVKEG